jgi:hypothetical protein
VAYRKKVAVLSFQEERSGKPLEAPVSITQRGKISKQTIPEYNDRKLQPYQPIS